MKCLSITTLMTIVVLVSGLALGAEPKYAPMPPEFSTKTDIREALLKYPLGVITKEAAFSHHGKAIRKVLLPNGNEGWVYRVGEGMGLRTFTLEFSHSGVVIDVLYNEQGRHNGLTALELQAQAAHVLGPKAESQPFERQSPAEFHYQK